MSLYLFACTLLVLVSYDGNYSESLECHYDYFHCGYGIYSYTFSPSILFGPF